MERKGGQAHWRWVHGGFEDVDKALSWSLGVRDSFAQRSDLDVRLGMAAGEPVDHNDDLFGAAVTMANRICSSAGPEQIYVSEVVRDLGLDEGFTFDGGQTRMLKGFSEAATIYELLGVAQAEIGSRVHQS